ncbi:hypothetical protein [Thalassobius sp. Cn5-15]|uniref:hypothetical protein n=1 Tax=Thalassobius sp. Cn5-15 TaxID=2917763 RepID=UPI001EF25C30|nr:hypothetical protein [Thalassobius sp. Cn5-15]MCG7492442.1 hypothetical protein [Thalassobius sp. Cn5-15]
MADNPHCEVKFLRGSWSTKNGASAVFEVADREFLDTLSAIGGGQRYMMVLAPIADDEELDHDKLEKADRGKTRVKQAAVLCQDKAYWKWLEAAVLDLCGLEMTIGDKEGAAIGMRKLLGVESRAAIGKDDKVGQNFDRMKEDFDRSAGRIK